MISIDQIELLFQMLILQNFDRKVVEVFPNYHDKQITFGRCEIKRERYGPQDSSIYVNAVSLEYDTISVMRFRQSVANDFKKLDFITWKEGNPIENEFEPFYKHLLNFVSFEDKI